MSISTLSLPSSDDCDICLWTSEYSTRASCLREEWIRIAMLHKEMHLQYHVSRNWSVSLPAYAGGRLRFPWPSPQVVTARNQRRLDDSKRSAPAVGMVVVLTDISNYTKAPRRGYQAPTRSDALLWNQALPVPPPESMSCPDRQNDADGGCGRGITETFIIYGDAELQAVKGPRSTDIRSLTSLPTDPLRALSKAFQSYCRVQVALHDKCA